MCRSIQAFVFALAIVSIAFAQIPTDSLLVYYPFDSLGALDTLYDLGPRHLNQKITGAIFQQGKINKALYFNGTSSNYIYSKGGDTNAIPASVANSFSISFWVNPQSTEQITSEATSGVTGTTSGKQMVIDAGQGGCEYNLCHGVHAVVGISVGTNGISVYECSDYYYQSTLVYQASISGWTHVVVVYTNNTPSLYLNGSLVHTGLHSSYIVHPNISFGGGQEALAWGGWYTGLIDEVRIYKRILTTAEILALYQNTTSPTPFNCLRSSSIGTPASFSVDSTFNSVVATFNTSVFSSIDTLYVCYEIANLTYLTQRADRPVNYTVNVGGSVADFGNNISTGTFSPKAVTITALKALSGNFQVTFNYTGGGGEIIFANPYLLVYGTKVSTGGAQKAIVHAQSLMKATAFPNPTHSSAMINYSIPFTSSLDISIYDAGGKIIKNVFRGLKQPGLYNYVWDGTNLSGSSVANGNYFFRVRATNGQQILEQIVVLK
jgi:hypothetical protein